MLSSLRSASYTWRITLAVQLCLVLTMPTHQHYFGHGHVQKLFHKNSSFPAQVGIFRIPNRANIVKQKNRPLRGGLVLPWLVPTMAFDLHTIANMSLDFNSHGPTPFRVTLAAQCASSSLSLDREEKTDRQAPAH